MCVCASPCLIKFATLGPPPPSSILVCFGCQIVPVWYFRYVLAHVSVCAYNSLPLFVCLLYLSVSFICLLPSCCPSPKQPSWPSFSYCGNHIPWSGSHLQTPSLAQPECQIISDSVPFLLLCVFVSIGLSLLHSRALVMSLLRCAILSHAHAFTLLGVFSVSVSPQWLS